MVAGIGQCSLDNLAFIDTYPSEDMKCEVTPWLAQGGGPVATALVALSRLGVSTRFMGLVSDDSTGQIIISELVREGVDISFMVKVPGYQSQLAFILVNRENGRRTIFWSRPTFGNLKGDNISDSFFSGVDMLHLDGLMLEAAIEAATAAKLKNIPVMLDVGTLRDGTEQLLPLCDYIVCSEDFSTSYCENHTTTLKNLLAAGAKAATVTLGQKGSITATADKYFHFPACKIKPVDTTGAGDVFHGGYIYGLLSGWPIEEVIKFATALAAAKCLKLGGRTGIPDIIEITEFMKKHELYQVAFNRLTPLASSKAQGRTLP